MQKRKNITKNEDTFMVQLQDLKPFVVDLCSGEALVKDL